ncbi:phage tail protein [Pseudomonas aeruginosa]|nr:phage tail protein [Pseudomonas aeruginosa]
MLAGFRLDRARGRRFRELQRHRFLKGGPVALYFFSTPPAFYDTEINPHIPEGAVEVSAEDHAAMLAGQANGKRIAADPDGRPILIDPPPPSAAERQPFERSWRDGELRETDPLVARHRDELEAGDDTTLTAEQYKELQTYRRELRNWPESERFPQAASRPVPPNWLIGTVGTK